MRFFVIFFSFINIALLFFITYLVIENRRLSVENTSLALSIDRQNETIREQALRLEEYLCDINTMKEYAIAQYKKAFNATKNDSTCEGRLKHLEAILRSYEE